MLDIILLFSNDDDTEFSDIQCLDRKRLSGVYYTTIHVLSDLLVLCNEDLEILIAFLESPIWL